MKTEYLLLSRDQGLDCVITLPKNTRKKVRGFYREIIAEMEGEGWQLNGYVKGENDEEECSLKRVVESD